MYSIYLSSLILLLIWYKVLYIFKRDKKQRDIILYVNILKQYIQNIYNIHI